MKSNLPQQARSRSPEPFCVSSVPLYGVSLVEASAGTGKTHAIIELYLRCIVEHNLPVESILVVTFTQAARAELCSRIRQRLSLALSRVHAGTLESDAAFSGLAKQGMSAAIASARLSLALQNMDQAAVYTIHAWCRRVLQDHAFESGVLFDSEISTEPEIFLDEIAQDFRRSRIAPLGAHFFSFLESLKAVRIQTWSAFAAKCIGMKPVIFVPDEPIRSDSLCADSWRKAEQDWVTEAEIWRQAWRRGAHTLLEWMTGSGCLNKTRFSVDRIRSDAAGLQAWIDTGLLPFAPEADGISRFTVEALKAGLKKNEALPDHPLPEAFSRLYTARSRLRDAASITLRRLRRAWIEEADLELSRRAREARVLFHDQLISEVHAALSGPMGSSLIALLKRRFPVALIDEFQDTDALQADIFHRVYGRGTDTALYLIGDPKQSIYAFRGADVFAYLRSAASADRRFSLPINRRSDALLVEAVNRLFGRHPDSFCIDGLAYPEVSSLREPGSPRLTGDPEGDAPVHVLRIDNPESAPMPKSRANPLSAASVASEIVRLLTLAKQGHVRWRNKTDEPFRSLEAGDMAVLVRTHRQGQYVRAELDARGVSSVILGDKSVFHTVEAADLYAVLLGVAHPFHEARLRASWMTEMMGSDACEIAGFSAESRRANEQRIMMMEAHVVWRSHGFSRMFAWFSNRAKIFSRLGALPSGERRLSNVRQLLELLGEAESEHQFGMDGLLRWFERRRAARRVEEDHMLRLESDEQRVHIVTIHRSKGLQYPVVFLPTVWEGSKNKKSDSDDIAVFHDRDQARWASVDLGSENLDRHREWEREEAFSESVRLLYVAFTRAVARVYLVLGRMNSYKASAAAWLFHRPDSDGKPGLSPGQVEERVAGLGEGGMWAEIRDVLGAQPWSKIRGACPRTDPYIPPESVDVDGIKARISSRRIFDDRQITSFSHLASHDTADLDQPEHDVSGWAEGEIAESNPKGFYAFPKGSRAGTALHAILEDLSFQASEKDIQKECRRLLPLYGFAASWAETVGPAIARILSTPLVGAFAPFSLSAISRECRIDELEFTMPISRALSAQRMSRLVQQIAWPGAPQRLAESIGRLSFGPIRGYAKGFIDLVFEHEGRYYLADYKSNYLGADRTAYRPERLEETMAGNRYTLQYLLYQVALHRFLLSRLGRTYTPDQHLGGIFYLFLRGMADARDEVTGVFYDRPSAAAIEQLSDMLGTSFTGPAEPEG